MSKNEKVTENKEQTEQKVMTKYDRKVQKRKEEKEKEKKEERISTTIGIVVLVALVCLVASFPIRTYLATHETYVVVNGEAVNKVEFDYQYNLTKNNYITQYGSYLTYFGLDTSKDLSTQMYSDTLSWQDYFEQLAVENLKQSKAMKAAADAEGFTYDTTDEYNTFKETIKTSAASAGISEKEYVRSIYGGYATMGRIEQYVKNDMVMNAYYEKLQEDNAPSDDEIQSYYEENKATYDSVDYRLTTIEAELPTEPTELADPVEETASTDTAADGTATTDTTQDTAYQPSDAEIAKAMEDAKVLADDAEQTVAKDGEAHENEQKSSVNYLISDWLFDDARKAGDTTVITNDSSHCYYVVAFEQRYLDETPSADVRVIIPGEDKTGEEILEEWKSGAATEDSFVELCKKYTQDTSAAANGGLFEQVTKSGMTEELSNWIFDSSRQAGDTVSIAITDDATYVLYYIGQDQPEWKINIKNTLVSQAMTQYIDDITADITVEDPKGKLNYLKVQAEESATAETAAAETQEITEEQTAATGETATQAQ